MELLIFWGIPVICALIGFQRMFYRMFTKFICFTFAVYLGMWSEKLVSPIFGFLPSGAECCEALAREVSGSEEAFVASMNQKAAALGMASTHFCNPAGLHDPEHVSTVRDMARLLRAAMQNEMFRTIFATARYTVPPTNLHPDGFTMESTFWSELDGTELRRGKFLGGKTGYTSAAGLCLASAAQVNGKRYILVTAGAQGNHNTEPYHVDDAVNVCRQLAR